MKSRITVVIATVFLSLFIQSASAQPLSGQQQDALLGLGIQYAQTTSMFEQKIQAQFAELGKELTREGRLDSEESAKKAAGRTNVS